MIGRTTIMAESAPLSSFAEPRTSAMNLSFAAAMPFERGAPPGESAPAAAFHMVANRLSAAA